MPIRHSFVSAVADGGDTDLVRPSDWNAAHIGPNDQSSQYGVRFSDDCFWRLASATIQLSGGVVAVVTGTSALLSQGDGGGNHPGQIQVSTGSTSTGRCAMSQGSTPAHFNTGYGPLAFGAVFYISAFGGLSNATNRYIVLSGLGNSAGPGANPSDFIGFRYTDNENGGNWQAVTRNAGTSTSTDTGVAATAADDFHRYEVTANAAGTEVKFYIDGTLVATNTTNIPTGNWGVMPLGIWKTVGTSARTGIIDAYWFSMDFTTER